MYDWRKDTRNPTDVAAMQRMDAYLWQMTSFPPGSRYDLIQEFCRDKEVLDIGAGEHDADLYNPEKWEHAQIVEASKKTVAIDLDEEICDHYRERGFDFRCVDATSEAQLPERFDRVFIGDVIEHVNDPIALLQFSKRHLKDNPDSAVLVTTPNPFAPTFYRTKRRFNLKLATANLEHTLWVTPPNMHEIAHRAGLKLTGLWFPMLRKPATGARRRFQTWHRQLRNLLFGVEKAWKEYLFVLSRGDD